MVHRAPLVVAVAVLVAGCSLPAAPGDRPGGDGSSTGVSERATFDRVEALLGVEGTRPPVNVTNLSTRVGSSPTRFQHLMGVSEVNQGDADRGRYVVQGGRVVVDRRIESSGLFEATLAHGYVHALQFERGFLPEDEPLESASTTDARLVRLGLLEGAAVWATDRYVDAHLPNATRQSTRLAHEYERGPDRVRFIVAPARFGHRYVDGRIDSPRDLPEAYEDPPTTTEQLLHPGARPEPPADLTLTAETGLIVRDRREDVQGELATRIVLRSELTSERARRAAEGWGMDRLREFRLARPDRDFGVAWALRWDTGEDADEFVAAFDDYADRRSDDTTYAFRVERVTDETVVVLAGPPTFVRRANATGSTGSVQVSFDDSNG